MTGASVSILLCDDHDLVRRGLRRLLETRAEFSVVGEAGDADEALRVALETRPDVVLMDVRLPGRSGIEACRDIRSALPATRVLMVTAYADDEALMSSIMAGASGYVLKQVRGGDILGSVAEVAAGRSLLDTEVTDRVLRRLRGEEGGGADRLGELSAQEHAVLAAAAEGLTNREIAQRLDLAEKTVRNYLSNILMKLGLSKRSEATAYMSRRRGDDSASPAWP